MIFILAIILLIVGIVLIKWDKIKPLLEVKPNDKKTIKKSSDAVAEVTAKVIRGLRPKLKPKMVGGLIMTAVPLIIGLSLVTTIGQTIIQTTRSNYNLTSTDPMYSVVNNVFSLFPILIVSVIVMGVILSVLSRRFL